MASASLPTGALVLDLGAGTGSLTAALVDVGARVVAVELHPRRAAYLTERFAGMPVRVVRADVRDLLLPRQPFYVVANPPFAATGPVLRRLLSPGSRLAGAHIVLQRGNARRWASGEVAGSASWMRAFQLEVERLVPRSAFVPRPSVDAAVLVIRRSASQHRPGVDHRRGRRPATRRRASS